MELFRIFKRYSTKPFALTIVFIGLILSHMSQASWIYQPFCDLLKNADIVVVAKVTKICEDTTGQYALLEPQEILKGQLSLDSLLKLPIHEIPTSGVVLSTDFDILYDSAATYLLLLVHRAKGYDIIHYPNGTKIKLTEGDNSLPNDVRKMVAIDTILISSIKAQRYTQLIESPHQIVRESAACALGRAECSEALMGLISALKDTNYEVLVNAIAGLYHLGRKGITSNEAVSSIENILRYADHTKLLISALVAQKGQDAIPFLHNFYNFCSDDPVRGRILQSLSRLQDPTVVSLFRDVIYDDDIPHEMDELKITVLNCLTESDTTIKKYADSIAIKLAMKALDYDNEYIQIEAIKLLESRTGTSYGDAQYISGFDWERAKVRKKIIAKWRKWYKNWLNSINRK